MIWPDMADLVVIAGATLSLDTAATFDLLNVAAADAALAEAQSGRGGHDPATDGASLLHALLRHHPFRCGNRKIAAVVTLQFLILNGWQADLGPAKAARAVIADLADGRLAPADFAAWLAPKLSPTSPPITQEAPMRARIPGRRRPAGPLGKFGRFTDRARQVVVLAQDEGRRLSHNYIGTEHILLGLVREGHGAAARALESLGISLEAVSQQVEEIIGVGQQTPSGHIPFTPRAKKVLELSLREAMQLGHNYIGTEHILLGLLREGHGVAAQVLTKLGADDEQIRGALSQLLASAEGAHDESRPPPGTRDVVTLGHEVDKLAREVARLQDLLRERGIEPGDGDARTA
jgi:Clp amino terminal domain, pathogenicity island component